MTIQENRQKRRTTRQDDSAAKKINRLSPDLCKDTAYGFLTRGCPRGCDFCIVGHKEGHRSRKIANLSEFWAGKKNIVLLDPNMFACRDWKDLSQQLIASRAWVDFSQGCDIRIMTAEKARYLKEMKIKRQTGWDYRKMSVYVLCGFNTTLEQDLERIYTLRDLGYSPYVMVQAVCGSRSETPATLGKFEICFCGCKKV